MTHEELLTQALAHDDYELTANLLSLKTDVDFKVDDKYTLITILSLKITTENSIPES